MKGVYVFPIFCGLLLVPATTHAGMFVIAQQAFSGGPGVVLILLTFFGLGSYLLSSLMAGIGQGQIAGFIRVGGLLACLITIANQAYDTLAAIARAMGIGL